MWRRASPWWQRPFARWQRSWASSSIRQSLVVVGVVHRRSDTNRIDFLSERSGSWRGEPHIAEPDKCDALMLVSPDDLPEAVVPYIRDALAEGPGPWIRESGWC
jgi:8-oxo-dGTP diphosphatase